MLTSFMSFSKLSGLHGYMYMYYDNNYDVVEGSWTHVENFPVFLSGVSMPAAGRRPRLKHVIESGLERLE